MAERDQKGSTDRKAQGNDDQADYNPTARNFDQLDVSGSPEPIAGDSGDTEEESADRKEKKGEQNSNASWEEKRRHAKNR